MEERTFRAQADIQKAEEARILMTNPVVTEVFDRLEAEYLKEWRTSAPQHGDRREIAYFRLKALDEVRQDIQSMIDAGRIAEFATVRRTGTRI